MSEFVIKIEAKELSGAILALAEALTGSRPTVTNNEASVTEKVEETPAIEVDDLPEELETEATNIKLTDVRKLLAAKSKSAGAAKVKALLTKYKAKRLTDVLPKDYAAMMEDAEAL